MTGKEDSTSDASKKTPPDLPVPAFSPTECPTRAEVESMLAREMFQLSVEEREKVLEDVHGIARVVDEPQDFIEACLVLLEKELIDISSKAAYDLASSMSKEYTSSKKRRLMFLRAESYDPCKAASRMVRFFDEKCELFGADKLTKDITQDDLDPGDIITLEIGLFQVPPEKDCAGRKVFSFLPTESTSRTTQNMLRVLYYTMMRTVEDDGEAQKRGFVGCAYLLGEGPDFDLQRVRKSGNLRNALPFRFDSVHICYNNPLMAPVFSFAMVIMASHSRMRLRSHYGSDEECLGKLCSFGIPIAALPVSPRGEFKNLENHRAFVATQRAIEATESKGKVPLGVVQKAKEKPTGQGKLMSVTNNSGFLLPQPSFANPWRSVYGAPNLPLVLVPPERLLSVVPHLHVTEPTIASRPSEKFHETFAKPYVIYDPLPNDILFGRGKPIQERPGNVRFREMIDTHKDKYEEKKKGAKVAATVYIVHLVKEEGGRFLRELEDGRSWVEVDEAIARAKVNNAFRTGRRVRQATLKKGKRTA